MFNNFNFVLLRKYIISIIISLYVFSYILGPAVINIFITILSLISLSFIFINKNYLKCIKDFNNLIFLVFFLLIFFTSFFNKNLNFELLSFLRIVLIYFGISFFSKKFIDNQVHNFKLIFCFLGIISIDCIYQYFIGHNILGYEKYDHIRLTGIFEDEPIIGSFLMKIVIPVVWLFFISKKISFYLTIFITTTIIAITFSGERMPLLQMLFAFFIIFMIMIINKSKKVLYFFLIIPFIILNIIFSDSVSQRVLTTFSNISDLTKNLILKNEIDNKSSVNEYFMNFNSGIYLWKENKYFGGGYRYYKNECSNKFIKGMENYCSTHPHNIYIEILSDYGLIGLLIFIIFLFNLSYIFWKSTYSYINLGIFIVFIITSVPFVTSQSIFSSYYGSIYFLSIFILKYLITYNKKFINY